LIDDLDRKIVRFMCRGVYSYTELGKLCKVGRSTIYRRVDRLERTGVIRRRVMALPNFEKLNLSAVIVGLDVNPRDLDKTVSFLKRQHPVKLLWKTFGTHDLIFTILCDKGDVGKCIYNLRKALGKLSVTPTKFDVSISISWEKMYLSP